VTAPRILVVDGGVPCRGTVRTPGEKSISHRAVLLAALAEGTSVVHGLSDGADVGASLAAVEAMGVGVEWAEDGTVTMHGGRSRLHRPGGPLDCGNSGTSMRLLCGLVAGFSWNTEVVVRPPDGPRGGAPRRHGCRGRRTGRTLPPTNSGPRWVAARR